MNSKSILFLVLVVVLLEIQSIELQDIKPYKVPIERLKQIKDVLKSNQLASKRFPHVNRQRELEQDQIEAERRMQHNKLPTGEEDIPYIK